MKGFTEIHSHFLYGLDDGAHSRSEMEAMLDAAYTEGVICLYATPHATPGVYPLNNDLLMRRLYEARCYCVSKRYPINILAGAEILYTPALRNYISDQRLPTLGNSDYVLVEFVPNVSLKEMEFALELLRRQGYAPVLAHVERYKCLFRENNLAKIKENYNVRCQINANSVLSKQRYFRARKIRSWFERNLIDFVASDAHDLRYRPFRMRAAYARLAKEYGREYANQLLGLHDRNASTP